jgi:pantetheine-phosphate adenylyltransferase
VRANRHAVLGGTFDHLHAGHAALLAAAFRAGRTVSIGVTTDRYLAEHPKPASDRLQPYAVRQRALRRWLARHYPGRTWRTVPLEDGFGRSVEPGVDVLVVSVDTEAGGRAVNAERRRLHRPAVPLLVVPVVLADDLGPVSSRRIRSGEIDPEGRRLAPIRIGVGGEDPADEAPVSRAVLAVFPSARLSFLAPTPPRRGAGAAARARERARGAVRDRDLGLGVARAPGGGWRLVERSPAVELSVREAPPGPPSTLRRAVTLLLRPARR